MSPEYNNPSQDTDNDYNPEESINTSSEEQNEFFNAAGKLTFKGKLRERGFFSAYFVTGVFIFIFSLLVYIISRLSPGFAEFWSRYPAYWLKFLLAKISSVITISIAELFLVSVPVLLIAYLVASWRAMGKAGKQSDFYKWLLPLIFVLLMIVSSFFTAFGPSYFRYSLDKNLSLDRQNVSGQELYDTAVKLTADMNGCLNEVNFKYGGASVMPYSYKELTGKINTAFKKYADKTDYINSFESYPKPIVFSELFTYTHISGVYTFMTGEANVNINYPDFIIPYTMAHEMAHQRGIAREDEANMVAFLVCMESDDAYVRYSGYSNMLNYLLNALYSADKSLYTEFNQKYYPTEVRAEFVSYALFFKKYEKSTASKVVGGVNDTFLKSQEQKAGTQSYGLVVDLTVAYYKTK